MIWSRVALGGVVAGLLGAACYGVLVVLPPGMRNIHEQDQKGIGPSDIVGSAPDQLDCGGKAARTLVSQVAKKSPPADLLSRAATASQDIVFRSCSDALAKAADTERDCMKQERSGDPGQCMMPYIEAQTTNDTCRKNIITETKNAVIYSIKNVRFEHRDTATGATECNATLHVDLPGGPQSFAAEEEISFKLERMEDGGTHIDVTGLR